MTDNKRPKKQADLDASAPQADGFSWSEHQTGTSSHHQEDEPRDLDEPGADGEGAVTMLDYQGTPVIGATNTSRGQTRAGRPEI